MAIASYFRVAFTKRVVVRPSWAYGTQYGMRFSLIPWVAPSWAYFILSQGHADYRLSSFPALPIALAS